MKSRPLTGIASAKANRPGRIGAEGCPPRVLLQSAKSRAWAATPFTKAASVTDSRRVDPNTKAGPGAVDTRRTIRAHGSTDPAKVTPTVSRMPILADSTAARGRLR